MTIPLSKWRKCLRKRSYATQREANKAIEDVMLSRKARDAHLLRSYECPHCHCWHFGHKKKPQSGKGV